MSQKPPEKPKNGETYNGACMMELKPQLDDGEDPHYLLGNTFLKNFVSIYDFDQQEVKLGVNIHSD